MAQAPGLILHSDVGAGPTHHGTTHAPCHRCLVAAPASAAVPAVLSSAACSCKLCCTAPLAARGPTPEALSSARMPCSWGWGDDIGIDPGARSGQRTRVWRRHRPQCAQLLPDCRHQVAPWLCQQCCLLATPYNWWLALWGKQLPGQDWPAYYQPHHLTTCDAHPSQRRELLPGHSRLALGLALTVRLAYLLALLATFPVQVGDCCTSPCPGLPAVWLPLGKGVPWRGKPASLSSGAGLVMAL